MKAVIFDVGTTMIYYRYKELREIAVAVCPDEAIVKKIVKLYQNWQRVAETTFSEIQMPKIIRRAYQEEGIDLSQIELDSLVVGAFMTTHTPVIVYPDVRETLSQLKARGLRLGIISNTCWPGKLIEADLDSLWIKSYFETMVWSHDFGIRKPDPRIFLECFERMNLGVDDAIYVGDKIYADIVGAHSVGMRVAWINRDGEAPGRGIEKPDWNLRDLRELIQIIEGR